MREFVLVLEIEREREREREREGYMWNREGGGERRRRGDFFLSFILFLAPQILTSPSVRPTDRPTMLWSPPLADEGIESAVSSKKLLQPKKRESFNEKAGVSGREYRGWDRESLSSLYREPVQTVHGGGGCPSLLPPSHPHLARSLSLFRSSLSRRNQTQLFLPPRGRERRPVTSLSGKGAGGRKEKGDEIQKIYFNSNLNRARHLTLISCFPISICPYHSSSSLLFLSLPFELKGHLLLPACTCARDAVKNSADLHRERME
jgi:hypothetical protein